MKDCSVVSYHSVLCSAVHCIALSCHVICVSRRVLCQFMLFLFLY